MIASLSSPLTKEEQEAVVKHLPLLYHLLGLWDFRSIPYEDKVQIGSIGLARAVKNHRKDGRAKFSYYASRCIWNELKNAELDSGIIRIPRHKQSGRHRTQEVFLKAYLSDIDRSHVDPIDYDSYEPDAVSLDVEDAMKALSKQEQDVVARRVIEGETLDSIGESYGVTGDCISTRNKKALAKMRAALPQYA